MFDATASGIEVAAMYPNSLVLSCIVVLIIALLLLVEHLFKLVHRKRSAIKRLYNTAKYTEKQCISLQETNKNIEAQLGLKAVELERESAQLCRLKNTADAVLLENQILQTMREEKSMEVEQLNLTAESIKSENRSLLGQLEEKSMEVEQLNLTTGSIHCLRAELEDLQRVNDSIVQDKEMLFTMHHESLMQSEQHLSDLMAENEEKERKLASLERYREVLLEQIQGQSLIIDERVSTPVPARTCSELSSLKAEGSPRKVTFGSECTLSDVRVASVSSAPTVEANAHQTKRAAVQYQKWMEENSSSDGSFDQSPIDDSFFVEPHELLDDEEHFPMAADIDSDGDSRQFSISVILHQAEVDNLRQRLEEEKQAIVARLTEERALLAASTDKHVQELELERDVFRTALDNATSEKDRLSVLLEHEVEKLQIVNDYAFRETNLVIEQRNRIETELAAKITDSMEEIKLLRDEIERLRHQVDDTREATSFLVCDKDDEIRALGKEKIVLEKKALELDLSARTGAAEVKRLQAEQALKDEEICALRLKIADHDEALRALKQQREDVGKLQAQEVLRDAEIEMLRSQLAAHDARLRVAHGEAEALRAGERDALLLTTRLEGEEGGQGRVERAEMPELAAEPPAEGAQAEPLAATPPPKPVRSALNGRQAASISTGHGPPAAPVASPASVAVVRTPHRSRSLEKFIEWLLHCGFDVAKLRSGDLSDSPRSLSSAVRATFSGSPSKILPFGRLSAGRDSPVLESSKRGHVYKLKMDINGNVLLLDNKFMSTILSSKKKSHITELLRVTKLPASTDGAEYMALSFKGQADQTVLQLVEGSALNMSFDANISLDSLVAYLNELLALNDEGPMNLQILLSRVA